jgi:hypothetical protein
VVEGAFTPRFSGAPNFGATVMMVPGKKLDGS